MKKFILKLSAFSFEVVFIFTILLFIFPKDNNKYLCEYNNKIKLIETTKQPRLFFIGASTVAFGIDSKRISDSLHINVINLGMHAGIGLRYVMEDCAQYIKKGDVFAIMPSYSADFKGGGNGEHASMIDLMMCTNWRNWNTLNRKQLLNVLEGIPFYCYSNLVRCYMLLRQGKSISKNWDTQPSDNGFAYVASGFNQYGDEDRHWYLPQPFNRANQHKKRVINNSIVVDKDFMAWFKQTIGIYKGKGSNVLIIPEPGTETYYYDYYFDDIEKSLKKNGLNFIASPEYIPVNDSCMFDVPGHLNRNGVIQLSDKLITILKDKL